MPFLALDDLAGRWFLLVLKFLAVSTVQCRYLALTTRFTPEGAYPDREFQVAFLELHPDAGADLGDTEKALIFEAAIRYTGHRPAGDHLTTQDTGHLKPDPTKTFRVFRVHNKAAILPVKSSFDLLQQVGNDLF